MLPPIRSLSYSSGPGWGAQGCSSFTASGFVSNVLKPAFTITTVAHTHVQNPSTVPQTCHKDVTSSTKSTKRWLNSNTLQFRTWLLLPLRISTTAAAHAEAVQRLPEASLNSQYRLLGSSVLFSFLSNFLLLFTFDCSVTQTGLLPSTSNITVLKSKSFTASIVTTAQFF